MKKIIAYGIVFAVLIAISGIVIHSVLTYLSSSPVKLTNTGWHQNRPVSINVTLNSVKPIIDKGGVIGVVVTVNNFSYTDSFSFSNIIERDLSFMHVFKEGRVIVDLADYIVVSTDMGLKPIYLVEDLIPVNDTTGIIPLIVKVYGDTVTLRYVGKNISANLNNGIPIGDYVLYAYIITNIDIPVQVKIVNTTTAIATANVVANLIVRFGRVNKVIPSLYSLKSIPTGIPIVYSKRVTFNLRIPIKGRLYTTPSSVKILVPSTAISNTGYMRALSEVVNDLRAIGVNATVRILPNNKYNEPGYVIVFAGINSPIIYDNTSRIHVITGSNPVSIVEKIINTPVPYKIWREAYKFYNSKAVFVTTNHSIYIIAKP